MRHRSILILLIASSLILFGCKSGQQFKMSDIFYSKEAQFSDLVEEAKVEEASKYFDENSEYFLSLKKENPEKFNEKFLPALTTLCSSVNLDFETTLSPDLKSLGTLASNSTDLWSLHKCAIRNALEAIKDYKGYSGCLKMAGLFSDKVAIAEAKVQEIKKYYSENSLKLFTQYIGVSEENFFDKYPVTVDSDPILEQLNISDSVPLFHGMELERLQSFSKSYRRDLSRNQTMDVTRLAYKKINVLVEQDNPFEKRVEAFKECQRLGFKYCEIDPIKVAIFDSSPTCDNIDLINGKAFNSTCYALPETSQREVSKIIQTAEAAIFLLDRQFEIESSETTSKESKYLDHYINEQNPKYLIALQEYNAAVQKSNSLQSQYNSNQAKANANSAFGNYGAALGANLANLIVAFASGNAQEKMQAAQNKLNSTPQFIKKAVYKDYEFDVTDLHVRKNGHVRIATYKDKKLFSKDILLENKKTFSIAKGRHSKDNQHSGFYDSEENVVNFENSKIRLDFFTAVTEEEKKANYSQIKLKSLLAELEKTKKDLKKSKANDFAMAAYDDERMKSVVLIKTHDSIGSGFYVTEDLVVTNDHVVEKSKYVDIKLFSGEETFGKVIERDPYIDLAIIKVQSRGKPVNFCNVKKVKVGSEVEAIGHPKGFEFSISRGIVSSFRKDSPTPGHAGGVQLIQTDTPINSGNSGGPLFVGDVVIGINTLKLVGSDVEGMGFALHCSEAKPLIAKCSQ